VEIEKGKQIMKWHGAWILMIALGLLVFAIACEKEPYEYDPVGGNDSGENGGSVEDTGIGIACRFEVQ
jgi:hypothetical protein